MRASRRSLLAATTAPIWTACRRRPAAGLIKVGVTVRITAAPLYLAHELGLFRDEGLNVEIVGYNRQLEQIPALVAGQIQAAFHGFTPALCNAIHRGGRIRIVAGRHTLVPGCSDQGAAYYRRARFPNGFDRPADWRGARIAIPTDNEMGRFYLDQLLAAKGVPPDSVEISRMRAEEAVAAAAGDHLDLFFGSGRPEFLAGGLPPTVARTDMLISLLGEFQYAYVIFGAALLDGNLSTGAGLLRAYLHGVRRFQAGETPRFLDEFASRAHMDPALVRGSCRSNISPTGEIRLGDMERWVAWAVAGKLTEPIRAEDMVDLRFQQAVAKSL
jgi:NitT/TauT family transport system substrate-binding protein